jgi:hypothetical protein
VAQAVKGRSRWPSHVFQVRKDEPAPRIGQASQDAVIEAIQRRHYAKERNLCVIVGCRIPLHGH